jgi:osmotically-inducible protein OsmY
MAGSEAPLVLSSRQRDDEAREGSDAAAQGAEGDHLAERVEVALRATGYRPLHAVEVSVPGRVVVLRGRLPSYYLKQLAQAAALGVPGVRELRNDVEVVP